MQRFKKSLLIFLALYSLIASAVPAAMPALAHNLKMPVHAHGEHGFLAAVFILIGIFGLAWFFGKSGDK